MPAGAVMKLKDCYAVLGVPRQTDDDTLKKAIRRRARKHNPTSAVPATPRPAGRT
jgi:DnaJ-domain-containing protein 1